MKNSPIGMLALGAFFLFALAVSAPGREPPTALSEPEMLKCEQRLEELGFWIKRVDGKQDESTVSAIRAFRRVHGYENSGPPNAADLQVLKKAKPLSVRRGESAHFEVDLRRQLLFFVEKNGRVSRILPVSTGNKKVFSEGGRTRRAITPRGRFAVYHKIDGWRESPLGQMYYPSYLVGGVSIHGSDYVADYPRTHGCIAVPMFAAEELSKLMPLGTIVIVHDSSRGNSKD